MFTLKPKKDSIVVTDTQDSASIHCDIYKDGEIFTPKDACQWYVAFQSLAPDRGLKVVGHKIYLCCQGPRYNLNHGCITDYTKFESYLRISGPEKVIDPNFINQYIVPIINEVFVKYNQLVQEKKDERTSIQKKKQEIQDRFE